MTRSRSRRSPRKGKSAPVSAKKQIYVSTEGQATEPDYVEYWQRKHRHQVVVVIDEFHGGPGQLVERVIRQRQDDLREERRGRGRAFDEYWCVFDRDEHKESAFIHRHDAQQLSKELLGCKKRLTHVALGQLETTFNSARTRAQALDRKHDLDGSAPRSNPSSTVWELIEAICHGQTGYDERAE